MTFFTGEEEKRSAAGSLAERTIGAAIAVHEALGPGYVEGVYAKALGVELAERAIPFIQESPVALLYKGVCIGEGRLDFLIDGLLVVELKVVDSLIPIHTAQLISYLKMTDLPIGLLINFNVAILKQGLRRVTHPRLYLKSAPLNSSSPLLL